jgi:hypothetical protein
MRPIPAPRIGDSHGLLRAMNERERIRLDDFVTEFSADELFPPDRGRGGDSTAARDGTPPPRAGFSQPRGAVTAASASTIP